MSYFRFDANGDGALSRNELAAALKSSGHSYSDVEVDAIFSLGDTDGDGEVSLQEFVDLMSPSSSEVLAKLRQNFKSINDVKTSFKKIDSNNDGLLSKEEMKSSPGCKFDAEEIDAIFKLGDINGDGELDMGEFIALMYPPATEVNILKIFYIDNIRIIIRLSASLACHSVTLKMLRQHLSFLMLMEMVPLPDRRCHLQVTNSAKNKLKLFLPLVILMMMVH